MPIVRSRLRGVAAPMWRRWDTARTPGSAQAAGKSFFLGAAGHATSVRAARLDEGSWRWTRTERTGGATSMDIKIPASLKVGLCGRVRCPELRSLPAHRLATERQELAAARVRFTTRCSRRWRVGRRLPGGKCFSTDVTWSGEGEAGPAARHVEEPAIRSTASCRVIAWYKAAASVMSPNAIIETPRPAVSSKALLVLEAEARGLPARPQPARWERAPRPLPLKSAAVFLEGVNPCEPAQ
jgi:hypothetical protein